MGLVWGQGPHPVSSGPGVRGAGALGMPSRSEKCRVRLPTAPSLLPLPAALWAWREGDGRPSFLPAGEGLKEEEGVSEALRASGTGRASGRGQRVSGFSGLQRRSRKAVSCRWVTFPGPWRPAGSRGETWDPLRVGLQGFVQTWGALLSPVNPGLLPPPAHPLLPLQALPGLPRNFPSPSSSLQPPPTLPGSSVRPGGCWAAEPQVGLLPEKPPPCWVGPSGPEVPVSLPGHLKKGEVRGRVP